MAFLTSSSSRALLVRSLRPLKDQDLCRFASSRVGYLLGYIPQIVLEAHFISRWACNLGALIPVSPASPEKAIRVCLLSCLVLSSEAFRMVAPLIAAFEAAMMVKSLPVIPSSTSLNEHLAWYPLWDLDCCIYMLISCRICAHCLETAWQLNASDAELRCAVQGYI